jgi:hypothetical protein
VKTTGLFIQSDHSLGQLQEKFTKTTREMISSPKGNISLTAALLTALLSILLLFYITKMKTEYSEARYRKESYICMGYLNNETDKYVKEMAVFNGALRTAFAAKATVVAGVSGEVIWKGLKLARDLRHFNYIRKIFKNKFCHFPETQSYLKNTPFKITKIFNLETSVDGTSIVREKQWTYSFYKNPIGIRLRKSFCLNSSFRVKNAFFPDLTYESKEISGADLLNSKCSYGP